VWTSRRISFLLFVAGVVCWTLAWFARNQTVALFGSVGTLCILLGSAAFLLVLLIEVPKWQIASLAGSDIERFDAENEARKTIAQVIAGVGLVAGLYFTSLQVRETHEATLNNQLLTRDGQITDRYIKAVQQLGSNDSQSLPVRIGAIFALERIARESKTDYWPIMELLSGYVRSRSGVPLVDEQKRSLTTFKELMPLGGASELGQAFLSSTAKSYIVVREGWHEDRRLNKPNDYVYDRTWPNESATEDVQAAITVLGRRYLEYEKDDPRRLNLRFTNLRGLNLQFTHLEGADLTGANLQHADLTGACLSGAELSGALLNEAKLERADLRRADLSSAVLLNNSARGADVRQAILDGIKAPEHEGSQKYSGFDGADTRGAMIDRWTQNLKDAVVVSEDGPEPPQGPFPVNKFSPCLQRSALAWQKQR
jgi:hypothetical protein